MAGQSVVVGWCGPGDGRGSEVEQSGFLRPTCAERRGILGPLRGCEKMPSTGFAAWRTTTC